MKTNPNESIHPEDLNNPPRLNYHSYGLTKREYFAAMALQGLNASNFSTEKHEMFSEEYMVTVAVKQADLLIDKLNLDAETLEEHYEKII